jgi:hypothetical protein
VPVEPADPYRPGHRRTRPTLRTHPTGELIHVDVKKLGNIPDGGGWRYLGRQQGDRNRQATRDRTQGSPTCSPWSYPRLRSRTAAA